jgi:hypothetical protein
MEQRFALERADLGLVERSSERFVNRFHTSLSPARLFELLTSIEHEAEWFPDFVSARWLTQPPRGVGARRLYRLRYMTIVEEFIVWEPGKHLAFRLTSMSLPLVRAFVEEYRLTPMADGGTELLWRVCFEPRRWLRPLRRWVYRLFERDFRQATRQLAALCERIARADGGHGGEPEGDLAGQPSY